MMCALAACAGAFAFWLFRIPDGILISMSIKVTFIGWLAAVSTLAVLHGAKVMHLAELHVRGLGVSESAKVRQGRISRSWITASVVMVVGTGGFLAMTPTPEEIGQQGKFEMISFEK